MALHPVLLNTVSEKMFQQQIIDLAKLLGWMTYHPFDSRRSTSGYPDLTLLRPALAERPARIIFAELKKQKGKVSKAQQVWLQALMSCTAVETYLWKPGDWDEIVEVLRRD